MNIDTSSEDKGSSAVEPSDAPGTTGNAPSEAGSAQGVKQPAPMTAGNPAQDQVPGNPTQDQVPGNPTQDQVPGNPTQSVAPPSEHPARRHNDITPLSAKRYKVTFTASEEVVGKLQQARALLSHVVVGNDLEGVIELCWLSGNWTINNFGSGNQTLNGFQLWVFFSALRAMGFLRHKGSTIW